MAVTFRDGFDSYAATADFTKKWLTNSNTSNITWNATAGRNGGGAYRSVNNSDTLRSVNGVIPSSFVGNFAFWFKASTVPSALSGVIVVVDASNNICGYWAVAATSGLPQLLQLAAIPVVTGSTPVCDGNWHWIELYCQWGTGVSVTSKCHVDGVQQWNGNVGSLNNSFSPNSFGLRGVAGATCTIDDLILYDNSGAAPINANYPVGLQQIVTLRPSSDSAVQFTPDTGSTNYTQINEVNGDTTHYVSDGTSGHQDLYGYTDLAFTPSTILDVAVNSYLNNPGVGAINHKQICKSGATQTDGASVVTPSAGATIVQQSFAVDPNTSAAWTAAGVNAALFGIKVA